MVEEATVDAFDDSERALGWHAVLSEHVELPFETNVLGVAVRVTSIDLGDGGIIVAICERGRDRQAIGIADLPLPARPPSGGEWIEAYRAWLAQQ
jgi:hypothetical protein